MTEHEIRVSFKKQLSDGNYGSETAEVTLTGFIEDEDEGDSLDEEQLLVRALLNSARRYVHEELYRSPSPRVRAALAPVPAVAAAPAEYDDDDVAALPF